MPVADIPQKIRTAGAIVLFFVLLPVASRAAENLAYYSDYFSFIGRDAAGFVALALDNNRGVDGADYQAEHFGVMYDQASGWVPLTGTGDYDNPRGLLDRIPDSPAFQFEGRPQSGLTIRSQVNALTLEVDPLVTHLDGSGGNRNQSWGSAQAVLHWKGRTLTGRVIYEYLVIHGWNRLTRTYTGTWDNFQGFYLVLDYGPPERWRDLYLRSEGTGAARRTRGFATGNDWQGTISSTHFKADAMAFNFGFYRWPQRWDIQVKIDNEAGSAPGRLLLHQVSRRNQSNWIIGGFAMSIVAGELRRNGETIPVLGWVELIK
jgi:hypothetical protein